jgi:probable F420-dependent oxidoreductase
VRLGVTMFVTDESIGPVALATAVEERGLASLYLPEHTHIPVSRRTPPPTGEPALRDEYKRTYDPFVALAAGAAATERITLGTGVCLVAQREPIVTAKAIASLDLVSGGRFVLGVGFGWNEDELEHHGVAMGARRAVAREHVLAMQRIWADDEAAFTGEHVRFSPSWSWPKPVQRPGPPVLLGGAPGPTLFAHVAEFADGWIPFGGAGIRGALPELRRACEARGRDPSGLHVVPMGVFPDAGKLAYYAEQGVTECVLRLPSAPRDRVLPVLDDYARHLARER